MKSIPSQRRGIRRSLPAAPLRAARGLRSALFIQAVERPHGFALECRGIAAAKAFVEHLVELELAIIVHGAERLAPILACCGA